MPDIKEEEITRSYYQQRPSLPQSVDTKDGVSTNRF